MKFYYHATASLAVRNLRYHLMFVLNQNKMIYKNEYVKLKPQVLNLRQLEKLPPKHQLPCFVKGEMEVWKKRTDLAKKYLDEMVKQYGK